MSQKDFIEKCFILKCQRKDLKILGNSRVGVFDLSLKSNLFEIPMNSRFRLENITNILLQSYGMRIKEKTIKEEG